jgi:hypothetical protein
MIPRPDEQSRGNRGFSKNILVDVIHPALDFHTRHHPGPERIELDIAHAGEETSLGIGSPCSDTFPQGLCASVDLVDVIHVAPTERLHHLRNPAFLHMRDQQVDVVGHQHIGVDPTV